MSVEKIQTSEPCTTLGPEFPIPANLHGCLSGRDEERAVGPEVQAASTDTALAKAKAKLVKNCTSSMEANEATNDFGYDRLDSASTKKEFDRLNTELKQRKDAIAKAGVTLEEATPFLERMQALTSQRGADRKRILQDAKVPGWTEWAKTYAKELNYTMRTLQARIKGLREGKKGTGSSDNPKPSVHYTKAQTDEMVSTCRLAFEAKKAIEAGRPVDTILAKVKIDDERLRDIDETARQLPNYRKCYERLVAVVQKYANGQVPASKIVEVAKEIHKETTLKQSAASLTEAAKAGKPAFAPASEAGITHAGGTAPAATPKPAEAKEGTTPANGKGASKPRKKAEKTAISGNKADVLGNAPAAGRYRATCYSKNGHTDFPVYDPQGNVYDVEKTPEAAKALEDKLNTALDGAAADATNKHEPVPDGGTRETETRLPSSKIVHTTLPGGPFVREFASASSRSWEPPTTKFAVCIGTKSQIFSKVDEAKAVCDKAAEQLAQQPRGEERNQNAALA